MNIKDLEFGNVVKFRDGTLCLIHPIRDYNIMFGERRVFIYLKNNPKYDVHLRNIETGKLVVNLYDLDSGLLDFDYNLNQFKHNYKKGKYFEIMEVYKDYTLQELLWKREEDEEDE